MGSAAVLRVVMPTGGRGRGPGEHRVAPGQGTLQSRGHGQEGEVIDPWGNYTSNLFSRFVVGLLPK